MGLSGLHGVTVGNRAFRCLTAHRVGDAVAHVPSLGDVAVVAEAAHELRPRARRAAEVPAGLGRRGGEGVAGQGRQHPVERVLGRAAVHGRVRQRADGVDQRQRVLVPRANADEVDAHAVDLGGELRQPVQPRLAPAPRVLAAPVAARCLHRGQLHALRAVLHELPARPAGRRQAATQGSGMSGSTRSPFSGSARSGGRRASPRGAPQARHRSAGGECSSPRLRWRAVQSSDTSPCSTGPVCEHSLGTGGRGASAGHRPSLPRDHHSSPATIVAAVVRTPVRKRPARARLLAPPRQVTATPPAPCRRRRLTCSVLPLRTARVHTAAHEHRTRTRAARRKWLAPAAHPALAAGPSGRPGGELRSSCNCRPGAVFAAPRPIRTRSLGATRRAVV
ncbi:hypothetical protein SAMN04488085_103376 [Geodermatophilus ruber]|uniref:Uncharacterized protein n=1 Tax=Geodermatophilus ruber TaxID=504800 RepID=A0A1I4C9X8_9ACTN|nr:hypothetical protein SAMN04488085_103376 [Geodermatophilus ruber]